MFRYLVAHLPAFRLERCGWLHSQPAALVAEEKSALRVQCATPAALSGGVRRGMTAAEARAVLPALQVETLQPEDEARDLDDLAQQLLRVSPSVRALPPDALVAEISRVGAPGGSSPRAGAERALLERVRLRLEQLGHRVTVVVADDPATAWACAAWGRKSRVVPAGQGADALAPLPLEALDLPLREQALLRGLGLRSVGAFAALPPASVVGRLGPVAVAAHALARGDAPRPAITPWQQDQPLVLTQPLMHPVVEQEALLFVLNGLLRDAAAHLVAADRAAVRLLLRLGLDPQEDGDASCNGPGTAPAARAPGGVQELPLRLGVPTRDPRRMLELLRARLERLRLAGPVISVSLELPDPVEFTGRQRDLLDRQRAAEALDEVVGRLQDELGSDAVLRPRRAPRHRPEAAWQADAWSSPRTSLLRAAPAPTCHADLLGHQRPDGSDPVRAWEGFPLSPSPVRPALLLHPAQSVELRTRPLGPGLGEQPVQLHADGRWHDLTDLAGPEALAGEWWRDGFDRRYWRATLADGRRAWLYLEEGHWALHGWFD